MQILNLISGFISIIIIGPLISATQQTQGNPDTVTGTGEGIELGTGSTTQQLLKEAKDYMKIGKIKDALIAYNKIIDLEPENHVNYFRRATAYLTIGRNELAIKDFDAVLSRKLDNHPARLKRAMLLLYQGSVDECLTDLQVYQATHPQDAEAMGLMENALVAKQHLTALNTSSECLMEDLDGALRICTKSLSLLLRRAECNEKIDKRHAIFDYSRLLRLSPTNNNIALKLSTLQLGMGELEASIASIKECLHNDPDARDCKAQFRLIKVMQKGMAEIDELRSKRKWKDMEAFLYNTAEPEEGFIHKVEACGAISLKSKVYLAACSSYHGMKRYEKALKVCGIVIQLDEMNGEALANRADAYMSMDEFEKARNDFKSAHDTDNQNQRYVEGFRKAETLLKRAGMKDYYKILGVTRSATQKEIKKAYRKQAQIYHPDKYNGDLDKDQVLQKMSDINHAHEVLGNEETRARYDQGEDPNDPQQQQGGHHHGGHHFFQQGFPGGGFPFPGGGGGGNFHFNF